MTEFDDLEFEGDEENGPKALRSALKKMRDEVKALREENATLKTSTRKTTVAAVLQAKGLPEKLAALYQGEPDEAAITAWADEYADVFGVKPAEAEPEPNEHTAPETQAQYQRMNQAQSTGTAPVEGL